MYRSSVGTFILNLQISLFNHHFIIVLSQDCFKVVSILQEQGVPHNVMMTYADPTVKPTDSVPSATIRIYIWPVKSSIDVISKS